MMVESPMGTATVVESPRSTKSDEPVVCPKSSRVIVPVVVAPVMVIVPEAVPLAHALVIAVTVAVPVPDGVAVGCPLSGA